MTIPVPGASIGTPYGRRGSWWSCHEDSSGNGIHTGVDYPAGTGTPVVAARGGTVHYTNHGSAFGNHQLEITPGDGTRDFYAHMTTRTVGDGTKVKTGDTIGKVGAEGNASGPHLHFERHTVASGGWSCSIVVNPQPSIDYQQEDEVELDDSMNEWSPDDGETGKTTVGKSLNQARGYAEDGYQRIKKLQDDVNALQKDVKKILDKM
jgi:murein DD-endopeptidase MepM/ murein hydrolase activator NlpD